MPLQRDANTETGNKYFPLIYTFNLNLPLEYWKYCAKIGTQSSLTSLRQRLDFDTVTVTVTVIQDSDAMPVASVAIVMAKWMDSPSLYISLLLSPSLCWPWLPFWKWLQLPGVAYSSIHLLQLQCVKTGGHRQCWANEHHGTDLLWHLLWHPSCFSAFYLPFFLLAKNIFFTSLSELPSISIYLWSTGCLDCGENQQMFGLHGNMHIHIQTLGICKECKCVKM